MVIPRRTSAARIASGRAKATRPTRRGEELIHPRGRDSLLLNAASMGV